LIEDPGYLGARAAFSGAGARLVPLPVDDEGLDILAAKDTRARLVYVTPSHQYPLGVTMSLARRLALLKWASRAGAWVLEDDYDSEYRYAGRPLAALQGLDGEGRVIYLGTFSKVLFPSLRMGYLVVPPDMVEAFVAARGVAGWYSPSVEQAILADFIAEGHFNRHIRRMRALYAERQAALLCEIELTGGLIQARAAEAGMHLIGWLPEDLDDRAVSREAAALGVEAQPLSAFCLKHKRRGGLLLGYAGYDRQEMREGRRKLVAAINTTRKRRDTAMRATEAR
jgi:GntR family transcriptional regulator/MocR family aminotransferase